MSLSHISARSLFTLCQHPCSTILRKQSLEPTTRRRRQLVTIAGKSDNSEKGSAPTTSKAAAGDGYSSRTEGRRVFRKPKHYYEKAV